jgi:hypothetical protein
MYSEYHFDDSSLPKKALKLNSHFRHSKNAFGPQKESLRPFVCQDKSKEDDEKGKPFIIIHIYIIYV